MQNYLNYNKKYKKIQTVTKNNNILLKIPQKLLRSKFYFKTSTRSKSVTGVVKIKLLQAKTDVSYLKLFANNQVTSTS